MTFTFKFLKLCRKAAGNYKVMIIQFAGLLLCIISTATDPCYIQVTKYYLAAVTVRVTFNICICS